jgi:lactoylglutathione lyase
VIAVSALQDRGVDDVWRLIEGRYRQLQGRGELAHKRTVRPRASLRTQLDDAVPRVDGDDMNTTPRPFQVLGIQQIAVGGRDKAALRLLWIDILGLRQTGRYRHEGENVDEDILTVGRGAHQVEIDLMQPIDPDARPRVHEPALNHVGLWVDNLEVAFSWLSDRGVRFTPGGIRRGASGHDVCFIHPKGDDASPLSGCGVLIELVQAPADLIAAGAG